ncbi:thymidylate kinase [Variovorax paradoxus]|jgi:dTMP kinase|uniref:dTMP kinase n=1 Tax=Variovorax paradoxus TaxID=34073 RepID=UPI0006E6AFCF|nr:thymidylate kinase [Variovorax paradoxus]KPV03987.1 thymidylate kinase [Variovorax paradoxus]KPV04018.1 thymidylate kinase [Variovorax paradoxus]KPV11467.1 thymidylate kinase [Variovorax paradoxus]KPV19872.1 thymidylate kinase [Variovorax paradoxus]
MNAGGLFLTLEGIDGAGKSSHLDALQALFEGRGRAVTRTREPGGTPLAETLRTLILEQPMDPLTESLLVFAARRDHIAQVIEPALARGDVVLCDRFTDATFAYQGGGRGFDTEVLSTLERWAQAGRGGQSEVALLQPHITLWFDLAPEIAAQRLAGARVPDKFEAQPVEFFRKVAQGYADRAAADAARFVRIDAGQSRDQVWQQVEAALVARGLAGEGRA